jgi:hypothetical protein
MYHCHDEINTEKSSEMTTFDLSRSTLFIGTFLVNKAAEYEFLYCQQP